MTDSEAFLITYSKVINSDSSDGKIADWLFNNYDRMTESMFFDPGWEEILTPEHILALRACTPKGVFTDTAKNGFLSRVGSNLEWTKLVKALFSTDYGFITNLPDEWQNKKSELQTLMRLSYGHRIRESDPRALELV